jgi:transcriptional antiterminator RfaH
MEKRTTIDWYAVQTKAGAESAAVRTLNTLDLEVFLPLARRQPSRCLRPLFPGYCFARFAPPVHLHAVRYSRGVLRVVGARETPWPIADELVAEIRRRLDDDGIVTLEPRQFRSGDKVRVCHGPFEGFEGLFDSELDDPLRVAVFLDFIQRARVLLERDWIEPLVN